MTAIVLFALVALFIGLRLYAVLGERTGHEQQPILKPADPDARVDAPPATAHRESGAMTDQGDLAYVPLAGPGIRALLAADPGFDVARFLEGASAAYRQRCDTPLSSVCVRSSVSAAIVCTCSDCPWSAVTAREAR